MVEVSYFEDDDGSDPVRDYTDAVEAAGDDAAVVAIFRELHLLETTEARISRTSASPNSTTVRTVSGSSSLARIGSRT